MSRQATDETATIPVMPRAPASVPLPASIVVGPYTYTVELGGEGMLREQIERGADLMGYSDHKRLIVGLDAGAATDIQRETLLHEVLHAVHRLGGSPIPEMVAGEDDEDVIEEAVVKVMSPLLMVVLRANPDLVAYLTG